MAETIYILCALTSTACAVLLIRGYLKNKTPLLLWSSLCFVGFAINNIILFIDLVIFTGTDLSLLRVLTAFISVTILVYGLVWETT